MKTHNFIHGLIRKQYQRKACMKIFFYKLLLSCFLSFSLCHPYEHLHDEYNSIDKVLPFEMGSSLNYITALKLNDFINKYNIKKVVELGSGVNSSTLYISQKISKSGIIYAIDTWQNDPQRYLQFLSNVIHALQYKKIIPLKLMPLNAAKRLKFAPELVYITNTYNKKIIYETIKEWYPKLKEGGIICGENWDDDFVKNKVKDAASTLNSSVNNVDEYTSFWWLNPKTNTDDFEEVDKVIKNKIILCTGPSLNRRQTLIDTINQDLSLIPYKKIFIATQDPKNLDISFNDKKPIYKYYQERGKQLDCINCIINSIKLAIEDPEVYDDDIIIFKHESVYINDMHLVKKALVKLLTNYDLVTRCWVNPSELMKLMERSNMIINLYATDAFFIKVSSAKSIFNKISELKELSHYSTYCEEFFMQHIVKKLPKVFTIKHSHSTWKDSELGLYHLPGHEDPSDYWDKKNYDELYL